MSSTGANNVSLRKESIGCEHLWMDGADVNGEWKTFTPAITGGTQRAHATTITVGRYKKIGKTVHVVYDLFHSGGAGTQTAALALSLPVACKPYTASSGVPTSSLGPCYITSTTASGYHGQAYLQHAVGLVYFRIINRATTPIDQVVSNAAVPNMSEAAFTLQASLTYEAL